MLKMIGKCQKVHFLMSNGIRAIQFTSRGETMCVSLVNGFAVFTVSPALKKRFHRFFEGQQFGNAVTLHDSSVIVCSGVEGQKSFSESTFCVFDESIGRVVLELTCTEPVQRIFMLPHMFSVAAKSEVRVYTFDPPILHSQYRTCANEFAPCDFVRLGETGFIVAMTGRQPGILRIVRSEFCDCQDRSIEAHSRPISLIKFNATGTLVATCSSLGTVVKLFNTLSGDCMGQYRRGTLGAEITSIAFSNESEWLAVASSKGTVHVFSIASAVNPDVPIRSEMRIQNPDLGAAVLCFGERNVLYAASKAGKLYVLRCSEKDKTINVERCEPFADKIAITK